MQVNQEIRFGAGAFAFTLNYDELIDHALPNWFDGFGAESEDAAMRKSR